MAPMSIQQIPMSAAVVSEAGVPSLWSPEKISTKNTFLRVDEDDLRDRAVVPLRRAFSAPHIFVRAVIQCATFEWQSIQSEGSDSGSTTHCGSPRTPSAPASDSCATSFNNCKPRFYQGWRQSTTSESSGSDDATTQSGSFPVPAARTQGWRLSTASDSSWSDSITESLLAPPAPPAPPARRPPWFGRVPVGETKQKTGLCFPSRAPKINNIGQTYPAFCATEAGTSEADAVQHKAAGRICWCHESGHKEVLAKELAMIRGFGLHVECFKNAMRFDSWLERRRNGRHAWQADAWHESQNQQFLLLSSWRQAKPCFKVLKTHLGSNPAADSFLTSMVIHCESKEQYNLACKGVRSGQFDDLPVYVCLDFTKVEKLLQELCPSKQA